MNAETAGAGLPAGGGLSPAVSRANRADRVNRADRLDDADGSRTIAAARQASMRLAHLARRMTTSRLPQAPPELRDLVEAHRDFHPRADISSVLRAYVVADQLHAGQMRRSGDPYITHPLAVAEALAELGVDTTTLIAGLLHDTVEDTGYTLESVEAEFGAEVANLVDGVTKLDKMRFGEAAEAETLRKLIVALARDYRVLVIKIADRLHNMRTLGFMSPAKQEKISRVTLEVLAPLAHRLGVSVIKRELEDRAFAVLEPDEHRRICGLIEEFTAAERETGTLAALVARLRVGLAESHIEGDVAVRISHAFSIYKRAQDRGRPPRDYYDIVRILVLVDDVTDCYASLGVIHALWRPVPGRLRDFVATPKFNMYQSLHTSVMDDAGRTVDIQIRTLSMHRLAETGIVARPVGPGADGARLDGLSWLHSLLDWQVDTVDPGEFLESLSSDLGADEVVTFTPKGKMIALPARSSPVDVAYAVHTDVGHRAIGARVNGRLVPLHTRLRNGDVVEILTSNLPGAGPSEDWLEFVRTARARVRIRRRLARQRREVAASDGVGAHRDDEEGGLPALPTADGGAPTESVAGRSAVGDEAARIAGMLSQPVVAASASEPRDVPVASSVVATVGAVRSDDAVLVFDDAVLDDAVLRNAPPRDPETDVPHTDDLPGAVRRLADDAALDAGADGLVLDSGCHDAASFARTARVRPRPARRGGWAGVAEIAGAEAPARLARCCLPLPGDTVVGFSTHGSAVSLHRRECANVTSSGSARERLTVTEWNASEGETFPTEIAVEAFDRYGLLADITEVLSDTSASVRAASTSTSEDRVAHARFTIEVTGPAQLDKVLAAVRGVGGVYDCYRACQPSA